MTLECGINNCGQLIGRPGEHHVPAEMYAVTAEIWVPVCTEHAIGFAESHDRVLAEYPEYAPAFRLGRLDEKPTP